MNSIERRTSCYNRAFQIAMVGIHQEGRNLQDIIKYREEAQKRDERRSEFPLSNKQVQTDLVKVWTFEEAR